MYVLHNYIQTSQTRNQMNGDPSSYGECFLDLSLKWTFHLISEDRMVYTGEREHATALYMACRHLPPQLLATPGEREGMLTEAAKILKKIGDNNSLEECYKLMKHFGISVKVWDRLPLNKVVYEKVIQTKCQHLDSGCGSVSRQRSLSTSEGCGSNPVIGTFYLYSKLRQK